ncbi:hypothetical protein T07_11029 [Trichinella nelsoni]|uniref:Uncharacterized protein n=1 Tax=Trichinella nelsoni TaxID=6336 RepID=A0A0V0RJU2_9BILA|nr:hypothetical protein T07_11029 [Trichinella nelsoni]
MASKIGILHISLHRSASYFFCNISKNRQLRTAGIKSKDFLENCNISWAIDLLFVSSEAVHQFRNYGPLNIRHFLKTVKFHGKFHRFWKIPLQTNASVSNKWPLKLPCAYLNTQGSSPFETPLKRILDIFRHYNLIFIETAKSCAIFRCFGQVNFPSFSVHFE